MHHACGTLQNALVHHEIERLLPAGQNHTQHKCNNAEPSTDEEAQLIAAGAMTLGRNVLVRIEVIVPAHEPVGNGEAAENEHRRQCCIVGREVPQPKEL